jgi:uncharacterized protein YndB with AHSA1/START domain
MPTTHEYIARAQTVVNAPRSKIFKALTDPVALKAFMFGSDVRSDWEEGSPITFSGEWQGRKYQDKGQVLKVERDSVLQYTHFSGSSGLPDKPENYHTVTIELEDAGPGKTRVALTQDNNATDDERKHSEDNWKTMLGSLKQYLEGQS